MKPIDVIIPAAGLGTRFLPLTKAIPKELVPLLDRPSLHYVLGEAVSSGLNNICIVTNKEKTEIARYVSYDQELHDLLAQKKRLHLIEDLEQLQKNASYTFIDQPEPLGLGHAVLQARGAVTGSSFGLMLPDDHFLGCPTPSMQQLIEAGKKHGASAVIALVRVPAEQCNAYGIVKPDQQLDDRTFTITDIKEKPDQGNAPSDLAIVGRYILPTAVFDAIEQTPPPQSTSPQSPPQEVQLTDALVRLIQDGHQVIGYLVDGKRFDTGTPTGWLAANVYLGMRDPEYAKVIREVLAD